MIKTDQITAEETIPLRHEVLRPGKPRETAIFSGDDLPATTHWAAFSSDGKIAAVATLMRTPKPGTSQIAWQVRGMASAPSLRGQGFGAAVLNEVLKYVSIQEPGAVVWCNARLVAVGFYLSQGFKTEGAQFEIAGVGPHYVMWRLA